VFELRDVASEDLAALVGMMRDPASATMAAFGSRDDDAAALEERWRRGGGRGHRKAIIVDGAVAGFVGTFEQHGETHVTYWIARSLWGRGLATGALKRLLDFIAVRPLHASTWAGNVGSQRVHTAVHSFMMDALSQSALGPGNIWASRSGTTGTPIVNVYVLGMLVPQTAARKARPHFDPFSGKLRPPSGGRKRRG
jgi:RimJ/RimL family protein N-acetyltransferase